MLNASGSSNLIGKDILIGALLRIPAQAIHRRLIEGLNASGFDDLRLPHIVVFQFPGPHGVRPGTLAERTGISKQAMNQLLGSLEELGYVRRASDPAMGRAKIVSLTTRGHSAYEKICEILVKIERKWRAELGSRQFDQLKELLILVCQSPLVR
jgi:DNA-binding MarR family transcriptional regulator